MSDENEVTETNLMPGADVQEPVQEALDLNFGLGEEVEDAEDVEDVEDVEEDVSTKKRSAVDVEQEEEQDGEEPMAKKQKVEK